MNRTPPDLRTVLDRFPERERFPANGRDPYDVERDEAAACIEMLAQRIRALSAANDKGRENIQRAVRTAASATASLAASEKWGILSRSNNTHRRAQRAEGAYMRLARLLRQTQECARISDASAQNAIRRLLGFNFEFPDDDELDLDCP